MVEMSVFVVKLSNYDFSVYGFARTVVEQSAQSRAAQATLENVSTRQIAGLQARGIRVLLELL